MLWLKGLGLGFFFENNKIYSIGVEAPFAGNVAGVKLGMEKKQVDALWGKPKSNYSDFMVYYSYRGKEFEIIYQDLIVQTVYLDN